MKRVLMAVLGTGAVAMLAGCPIQTNNNLVMSQNKPLDVNLNVHVDTINIVISDARKDTQQMMGSAPAQTVDPSAIGLPPAGPATQPGALGPALEERDVADGAAWRPVLTLAVMTPMAAEDDLKNSISGRIPQVRWLLDEHVAGETHTGMLAAAPGAKLTAAEQAIITAENGDRAQLYAIVAKKKGTSVDDVGLSYYLARLGYAKAGDWYDKFNKGTGKWEWAKWG